MTLDELRAFLSVAESGSFSKAAAELYRSQPAVSRRIDVLETELGTALFTRHGRTVSLTPAGEALLPHAGAALAAVEDARKAVANVVSDTEAVLSVAVVGTIADSYLVEALKAFQDEFSNVHLDLQTANSLEVSDLVNRGAVAIGLRYHADSDPRLDTHTLGAERLYVVVPANHRVRSARRQNLKPFAKDRWLGFPTAGDAPVSLNGAVEAQFIADGEEPPEFTIVDSLTAQKRLVEAGFGVALMPKRNVQEELNNGSLRLIEVASLTAQLPVVLLRRRTAVRSPSEDALVAHLTRSIPEMLDT